ncbi:NAD(P)H-hydrate dehydratase [Butyrivibrio sp. MC2013]|uniref:NAD(P)H-hydrate dehydratase n=1 Tax=Butyrivibrio sp. MC2013 TaxID=1280686 RepID=UPI0018CA2509|nr:NAD(P)H-hydrate dehydratase [Butyrivibrio sp. MC2013]
MQYLTDSVEMRTCDNNTIDHFGIPALVLMERAGLAIADEILKWAGERKPGRTPRILSLCGRGGNGGDGVCAARILACKGCRSYISMVEDNGRIAATLESQIASAEAYNIPFVNFDELYSQIAADNAYPRGPLFDVIIDAGLGIGADRELSPDYLKMVRFINSLKDDRGEDILVISADIPTGISADSGRVMGDAVKADVTVTFNYPKIGHILYPGADHCGRLLVADVGISKEGFMGKLPSRFIYGYEDLGRLPPRNPAGNKGSFGKVLIAAGNAKVSGACLLSAAAALKSGAGMVKVFTDRANIDAVKKYLPEAMFNCPDEDNIEEELLSDIAWADSMVVGPGIGTDKWGRSVMSAVLMSSIEKLVIDADAITLIAMDDKLKKSLDSLSRRGCRIVATPHMAEFARLYNAYYPDDQRSVSDIKDDIWKSTRRLSDKMGLIIAAKDARTVVTGPYQYLNVSGNSGMATAGSGDVLTGVIASLLNLVDDPFTAVCLGVYIHGLAGDAAAGENGECSITAVDIVGELAGIFSKANGK